MSNGRFAISTVEMLESRQLFSLVVALAPPDQLLTFDSANPNVILSNQKVRGLQQGDRLVGIDYRPATGELFGVGRKDFLYTIDDTTGRATLVGTQLGVGLNDRAAYGFDFNPSVDRLRIVNSDEQNLRANPLTGAAVDSNLATPQIDPDGTLAYAPGDLNAGLNPSIVAIAYSNNVAAGTPTTLYAIDSAGNSVVTIGSPGGTPDSPNTGILRTAFTLGFDVADLAGFDIVTANGVDTAYAAMKLNTGRVNLYRIDLQGGTLTDLGRIGKGRRISGLAVVPEGSKFFALRDGNYLQKYDVNRPDAALSTMRITGLASRERLAGIDIRPATGELFAVGLSNRIYTIDTTTAVATQVGPTFAVPFTWGGVGFDFNPTVDRIRLVNVANQNFRLNPITGAVVDTDLVTGGVQVDGDLFYADATDPRVAHVAYTNSFNGATTTTLYGIDDATDSLVTIGGGPSAASPNTGALFNVGPLGIDAGIKGSFDIVTTAGTSLGYAALAGRSSRSTLYTIDLTTGAATVAGAFRNNGREILGIVAIP